MRRVVPIAALVVLLALPLWAQRGGGSRGGGFVGHGSFNAGSGHVSGGTHSAASASHAFISAPSSSQRPSSQRTFSQGAFSNRGFSHNSYSHDGFRGPRRHGLRNCYGYGCWGYGYPWAYGGYYEPFWWGDSGSSYDDDYERDRVTAEDMNQESIEEQQMLRQEQADGDRDAYARSDPSPRPAPSNEQPGTAIIPATVLVFHDQHRKEIQNYAIVGQTLWNFAPQHTEKIPLSDLDLPATTKANDDRGLTFRVPSSNEAQ